MVDELELLKKDWKRQEATLPKVTAQEIYPMLLKKSSSIIKWIFLISIVEFVFWMLLSIFLKGPSYSDLNIESSGLRLFENIFLTVHGSVLLYFIIQFYKNFKSIKSTDSAAQLMKSILRTRKAVKHFIFTNLVLFIIGAIITTKFIISLNTDTFNTISETTLLLGLAVAIILFSALLWFIYSKVYGIFLRRLQVNYKELEKMEA